MDADVVTIYERLSSSYPIILNSSFAMGYKSDVDYPVLSGESALGKFEMFFDDVSFAFYVMGDNGDVFAHWHLQTASEAEKTVVYFMEGKIKLVRKEI